MASNYFSNHDTDACDEGVKKRKIGDTMVRDDHITANLPIRGAKPEIEGEDGEMKDEKMINLWKDLSGKPACSSMICIDTNIWMKVTPQKRDSAGTQKSQPSSPRTPTGYMSQVLIPRTPSQHLIRTPSPLSPSTQEPRERSVLSGDSTVEYELEPTRTSWTGGRGSIPFDLGLRRRE